MTPSAAEQYFLELINRARATPAVEAGKLGTNLNEGLAAGTLSSVAKQPLAFNTSLIAAARNHTQDLLLGNRFSHVGSDGADALQRMIGAGYTPAQWGENLGWYGLALSAPELDDAVNELHRRLFLDDGVAGRGHRINILSANFSEIGVGIAQGWYQDFNSALVTSKFATRGGKAILTGVAYTDGEVKDQFYTPGEGIGGVRIRAVRVGDGAAFTTTTWESGGYSLELPAGQYTVSASGGGLPQVITSTVTIAASNVKLDVVSAVVAGGGKPVDKNAPTAKLAATKHTRVSKSMLFRITYVDDGEIDQTTIGTGDVRVTTRGFNRLARFVSKVVGKYGSITATYRIDGPGGSWDAKKNGKYAVRLISGEIADAAGNGIAAQKLGVLTVQIGKGKAAAR